MLTRDHDCQNPAEVAAVRSRTTDPDPIRPSPHGNETLLRVAGILAVTRALGDGYLKDPPNLLSTRLGLAVPYITAKPELTARDRRPATSSSMRQWLLLASDGLYNWMSNEQIAKVVCDFHTTTTTTPPEDNVAQHLVDWVLQKHVCPHWNLTLDQLVDLPMGTHRRMHHDDITVLIADVSIPQRDNTDTDADDEPPAKRQRGVAATDTVVVAQ